MLPVPMTYFAPEVAAEAACPEERVRWMTRIGLVAPDEHGRFTIGAVLAVKMASALLDTGVPAAAIERAATEGLLSFQRTDEYLPYEPGPRSERTFAEFQANAGPRAELLPAVYGARAAQAEPLGADPPRRGGNVPTLPRCLGDDAR